MTTNQIVLTPLASWAESKFSGMFAAKDEKTFDEAFDSFVAGKPTSIVVNDKHVTREQFKQQLFQDRAPLALGGAPDLKFAGAVGVPRGAGVPAGEVGLFVTAQSFGGPRVHDSPSQAKTVTLSANAIVREDHTLPPHTIDTRRAFSVTAVSSVETQALHPNFAPPPTTTGGAF